MSTTTKATHTPWPPDGDGVEVARATARLIAAAPNLLEALETVLDEVVFLEHAPSCASGVGAQGYDPANCNGCSLHQARAAIAQARGENL